MLSIGKVKNSKKRKLAILLVRSGRYRFLRRFTVMIKMEVVKKRKIRSKMSKLLDISQSVAAHGLKEAAGAGEDVSSSEDE